MTAQVRVGQVWEDLSRASRGRTFRITRLATTHVVAVVLVDGPRTDAPGERYVLGHKRRAISRAGRETRIRIAAFGEHRFRLLEDPADLQATS